MLAKDASRTRTKLFTAGLVTESLDFTPISTTEKDWKVERPESNVGERTLFYNLLTLFRELAEAKGWSVLESICATAFPPGGRTVRAVYEDLRSTILEDLQQAMPIDAVLLQLHGAAMAHGYDDCEGDLLEHIRHIIGPDIPVGVELDPHCHMTDKMMKNATVMILYKTFLHTDMKERAMELFNLIADTMEGRIKPVMSLFDCKMIDNFDEAQEPMKSFLKTVYMRECENGILSISPVHGFPLANVADMGSKMLVITDSDLDLAYQTAEELGMAFYETRGQLGQIENMDIVLDQLQERAAKGETVIQLVELSDIAGGGFPTDGTHLLQAMFKRGMTSVAVGLMWDPIAVRVCHDAGPGVELMMRIGGKATPLSGTPMDLNVVVERIYKDFSIATWFGVMNVGDAAVLRSRDTDFLLVSKRVGSYGAQAFRDMGVEPNDKNYLLLKAISRDEATFVVTPRLDYKSLGFTNIVRPKWPWDEHPFEHR